MGVLGKSTKLMFTLLRMILLYMNESMNGLYMFIFRLVRGRLMRRSRRKVYEKKREIREMKKY